LDDNFANIVRAHLSIRCNLRLRPFPPMATALAERHGTVKLTPEAFLSDKK
jgi:hypothetical protein